jgi:hypothetical protein
MKDAATIADRYLATWNETDAQARRALLERHWAEHASYIDPLMQGSGHPGIDGLIAAVHQKFPGFRFALKGAPDGYGKHARFSWMLGPADAPDLIEGTDFVRVDKDRIESVNGFLDKVPSSA